MGFLRETRVGWIVTRRRPPEEEEDSENGEGGLDPP